MAQHQYKLMQHVIVDHCPKKKSNDAEETTYVYIVVAQGILQ